MTSSPHPDLSKDFSKTLPTALSHAARQGGDSAWWHTIQELAPNGAVGTRIAWTLKLLDRCCVFEMLHAGWVSKGCAGRRKVPFGSNVPSVGNRRRTASAAVSFSVVGILVAAFSRWHSRDSIFTVVFLTERFFHGGIFSRCHSHGCIFAVSFPRRPSRKATPQPACLFVWFLGWPAVVNSFALENRVVPKNAM